MEGLLYIPQVLAGILSVYLIIRWTMTRKSTDIPVDPSDGFGIFAFRLLRLLSVFALLGLECFQLSIGGSMDAKRFEPFSYVSLFPSVS
jgi:hypothetical protein